MTKHPRINLVLSASGVELIELLYPHGQRSQAWLLCRQILPQLERLEQSLAENEPEFQ